MRRVLLQKLLHQRAAIKRHATDRYMSTCAERRRDRAPQSRLAKTSPPPSLLLPSSRRVSWKGGWLGWLDGFLSPCGLACRHITAAAQGLAGDESED